MADSTLVKTISNTCITFSFILAGNAITQSFMTLPALLADWPSPTSPEHATRARLLGRQWPYCWSVGNVFFRPISALGFVGYAYTAYSVYQEGERAQSDWRVWAFAALAHFVTVLHSALNMQPLNDKLEALVRVEEKELKSAKEIAERWAKWNLVRLVNPVLAGAAAISQSWF
ncbi:hypothetical protein M011DRAFT_445909 [Sporormia fimetaria CBS 119925]|uniref:DUF1772-domain-containing protein n=1 Tax=Sporormia fimetaria CBS 119925 TaxID=1340428 RepID=A0A6A6V6R7_9PLEO|nr:hypothetical protein M011DRAFT_445909 [Sporormia fimetaria CBS 119925]